MLVLPLWVITSKFPSPTVLTVIGEPSFGLPTGSRRAYFILGVSGFSLDWSCFVTRCAWVLPFEFTFTGRDGLTWVIL